MNFSTHKAGLLFCACRAVEISHISVYIQEFLIFLSV